MLRYRFVVVIIGEIVPILRATGVPSTRVMILQSVQSKPVVDIQQLLLISLHTDCSTVLYIDTEGCGHSILILGYWNFA